MNEIKMGRDGIGDAELRLALRGLRRDVAPERDLWPGIASRIDGTRQASKAAPFARGWLLSLATAASLVLALGIAMQFRPQGAQQDAQPVTQSATASSLVQREAETMTLQYRAALQELDTQALPASWRPGIDTLDRSAAEIRAALKEQPDSRLLLERLRETYTRRLALSRRALYA